MNTRLLGIAALAVALCASSANAQLQSQVVAGSDNGSTRRILKTDNTGRLEVVGSAAGGVAYGPDNQGVAPTQAPITIGCTFNNPTVAATQIVRTQCDANGKLLTVVSGGVTVSGTVAVTQSTSPWVVGQSTAANLQATVVGSGPVSNGTAQAGSLLIGGVFNSTLPTLTNGQQSAAQFTSRGALEVELWATGSPLSVAGTNADAVTAASANWLGVRGENYAFNGSTWDRTRTIEGASANTGLLATVPTPNTSTNAGITPVVSSALEGSHVIKASAGNFYRGSIITTSVAGWFMVFNATSAPADGAVTPVMCSPVPANGRVEIDHSTIPDVFSTGVTFVFSSTDCFTKTISNTARFEGSVK